MSIITGSAERWATIEQLAEGHASREAIIAHQREIDERVYRLYGLTADEIKFVEEGAAK